MRIKVTFDNEWTKEEMREYLSNMENERYQDLYYDELLELAACSSIYLENPNLTQEEINRLAQEDICDGIDEFFFSEMCNNYISYYNEAIKERSLRWNKA